MVHVLHWNCCERHSIAELCSVAFTLSPKSSEQWVQRYLIVSIQGRINGNTYKKGCQIVHKRQINNVYGDKITYTVSISRVLKRVNQRDAHVQCTIIHCKIQNRNTSLKYMYVSLIFFTFPTGSFSKTTTLMIYHEYKLEYNCTSRLNQHKKNVHVAQE